MDPSSFFYADVSMPAQETSTEPVVDSSRYD
jgi:hypothetical protein